jgi:CubicO group peptidase (beta-lactamase class C family)
MSPVEVNGYDGSVGQCLSSMVQELVRNSHAVGLQLHVKVRDAVVADLAAGQSALDTPMRRSDLIWLSCMAKPLTAIAIAIAHCERRLDIDMPVAALLPAFAVNSKQAITIADLLTHETSVLEDMSCEPSVIGYDVALSRACSYDAGSSATMGNYSAHWAWTVLQEIIERVYDVDLASFLYKRVLRPWNLHDIVLTGRDPCGVPRTLTPRYYLADGEHVGEQAICSLMPISGTVRFQASNGGVGTAAALAQLLQNVAVGRALPGDFGESCPTLLLRQRRRTGVAEPSGYYVDYALGLQMQSVRPDGVSRALVFEFFPGASDQTIGHRSLNSGTVFSDPVSGLTVALLTNTVESFVLDYVKMKKVAAAIRKILDVRQSP